MKAKASKKMTMKESGKNFEALDKALQQAEDMFERAVCPFFLFGETLRGACEDNQIKGEKVELGVFKKHLTPEAMTTFTSPDFSTHLEDFVMDEDRISWRVDGMPVEITIIKRKYKCLSNPDSLLYKWGDYLIPNPLEDYWKIKGIIR